MKNKRVYWSRIIGSALAVLTLTASGSFFAGMAYNDLQRSFRQHSCAATVKLKIAEKKLAKTRARLKALTLKMRTLQALGHEDHAALVARRAAATRSLELGLENLKAGKIAEAQKLFDAVFQSHDAILRYSEQHEKDVEREAKRQNLFSKAYKNVFLRRDLARYQWASDVFRLLKDYLPNTNTSKVKAAECLQKIERQLSRLQDQHQKSHNKSQ